MKVIEIAFVKGNEGYSLQVWGKTGGYRYAGPKPWGNPFNKPEKVFKVDLEDFIKCLQEYAYEDEDLKLKVSDKSEII